MKPVFIMENSNSSLVEKNASARRDYIFSGIFTEFGIKNRNERIYTAEGFLPALAEMNERIQNMAVYGEFDHPEVFDTSLKNASHLVTKAKYNAEKNAVLGEIKLLNTKWGKEARSLVDDNCPLFVSSRAAGVTEGNGTVSIKKLFSYDLVADPGFASARMNDGALNESLGFCPKGEMANTNYRVIEITNESQINELFKMNKHDNVTKMQMAEYSKYLIGEIANVKSLVEKNIHTGDVPVEKMEQLFAYYEELNNANSQVIKYLDYLADKVSIVVKENLELKDTTSKLIKHNDYLAENLEKSIAYSEYISEKVKETQDKTTQLNEKVSKTIQYAEYLAENLDKNIAYSEYIAENLDNNIAYSEYIAENLDNNIKYSEYIAENLTNSIKYSEYLAENVQNNIAYSEYIAENLGDSILYTDYLAENLNKSINTQLLINEALGEKSVQAVNEAFILDEADFDFDVEDETVDAELEAQKEIEEAQEEMEDAIEDLENELTFDEECDDCENELTSESIDKMIEDAKKQKVSESSDLNFLKFLNKSQVASFNALSKDDQDKAKLHINESGYFCSQDVLRLISEAVTVSETLEERLVRLMPANIEQVWENVNDADKKAFLTQARLYPSSALVSESQVANFWNTRNFKQTESTKTLVSQETFNENVVPTELVNAILEKFGK